MAEKRKRRRGFSFVNKEMHYRYVGLSVLIVLIISIIMTAFIFTSSFDTITLLKQLAQGNEPLVESLRVLQIGNLLRVILALGLILVTVAVVGVIEMSKIAGPLYRMSKVAKEVADGNYAIPLKIRSGDIPTELADSFDNMIGSVRDKAKKEAATLDAVCSKVKSASAQIKKGKVDQDSARALEEVISTLSEISRQKKTCIEIHAQLYHRQR